jgi:hypothetical protein
MFPIWIFSKLEIIFCAFLPFKGALKRMAANNFVNALESEKLLSGRKKIQQRTYPAGAGLIPFIGVRKFFLD